jgi:D-glycero-beta-D-manno-heptose 1-phosphate adenylyltransferase
MQRKLDFIKSKIIWQADENLQRLAAIWKFQHKKVVFTNGCFDLLHRGHIEYLAKAAGHGDYLVVGLNSDVSIRSIKGNGRPILDQESRALILASLHFVHRVILFEQDTPYELIKLLKPDVLIKGGDYKPGEIVGYDIVKASGGKIATIEYIDGFSTSSIIENIRKQGG